MKREIRFRGKRLDNGEWAYGSLITCHKYTDIWTPTESGTVDRKEVDPETVGQYTGLEDRDGREIYEGDILLLSDRGCHEESAVVEHGLYGWTFYGPKNAVFQSDGSHTYRAVENCRFMFGTGVVVGNIHDNPELTEGGGL